MTCLELSNRAGFRHRHRHSGFKARCEGVRGSVIHRKLRRAFAQDRKCFHGQIAGEAGAVRGRRGGEEPGAGGWKTEGEVDGAAGKALLEHL